MDEERITTSIVAALRDHPAEWLTFKRVSRLVAAPGVDEDVIASIAEFRQDLFAIDRDRKLKLRENIVADISRQGMVNWAVPPRQVRDERRELEEKVARAIGSAKRGCYCSIPDSEILADIIMESVPDEALILGHCWITICRVRGPESTSVPPEVWSELCRRRAVIKRRENPQDF